jgi:hypothetical protein
LLKATNQKICIQRELRALYLGLTETERNKEEKWFAACCPWRKKGESGWTERYKGREEGTISGFFFFFFVTKPWRKKVQSALLTSPVFL